jgi:hypothetical protein
MCAEKEDERNPLLKLKELESTFWSESSVRISVFAVHICIHEWLLVSRNKPPAAADKNKQQYLPTK